MMRRPSRRAIGRMDSSNGLPVTSPPSSNTNSSPQQQHSSSSRRLRRRLRGAHNAKDWQMLSQVLVRQLPKQMRRNYPWGMLVVVMGQLFMVAGLLSVASWLTRWFLGSNSNSNNNNSRSATFGQQQHPHLHHNHHHHHSLALHLLDSSSIARPPSVLFGKTSFKTTTTTTTVAGLVAQPAELDEPQLEQALVVDHGDLDIRLFVNAQDMQRVIYKTPTDLDTVHDQYNDDGGLANDNYYAFDDDMKRNPYWEEDLIVDTEHLHHKCRRTSWHRRLPINCNVMHEFDFTSHIVQDRTKFAGQGSYRQVFLVDFPEQLVAYKEYVWGAEYDFRNFEFMRMDAVVMELMNGGHDSNIVQSYAYCGTGILNEGVVGGDFEHVAQPVMQYRDPPVVLDDKHGVNPLNDLTATQKLVFAKEMAEAVAELHGFRDGVIVHDDIHMGQFLLTEDGHLKLHDFNRAEIMLWDDHRHEYCRYQNNPGNGEWRAPEEYRDDPLNEKIDVYSLGMNFYATLTGLLPFYDLEDTDDVTEIVQQKILNHEHPPIDERYKTRSFAEGKLVEIIYKCWEYDADDRIDIFQLVDFLRQAVVENKRLEQQKLDKQKIRGKKRRRI